MNEPKWAKMNLNKHLDVKRTSIGLIELEQAQNTEMSLNKP